MEIRDRQANPWLTRLWTTIRDLPVYVRFQWTPRDDPNIQRVDKLSRGIPNAWPRETLEHFLYWFLHFVNKAALLSPYVTENGKMLLSAILNTLFPRSKPEIQ
jgi:hypothetical protein